MIDIFIDTDYDILLENGDLAIGESSEQHQELLLTTRKGDWKENPTIAVGVEAWLKDDDAVGMLAEIKKEFERDGMTVKDLKLENETLTYNANY